jgi:pimeloyl-ACP methyl ester carboxylesterase
VPHVALRLCWEAQSVDDVAAAVAASLARHGYRRACVVGHSYGTFVASRLCQLYPQVRSAGF